MLNDYQTLARLLQSQSEALQQDDSDRLAALLPLIDEYSRRTARHEEELRGTAQRSPLLDEARSEILRLAAENSHCYRHRKDRLRDLQSQLQSAGRYLRQVRRRSAAARQPVSWTG